jgi:hypothetical protein
MSMTLQGKARVRRVGNGLCIPIPTREARADGIAEGDEVSFIIIRPDPIPASAFGAGKKFLKGADLQALMDEDRGRAEE